MLILRNTAKGKGASLDERTNRTCVLVQSERTLPKEFPKKKKQETEKVFLKASHTPRKLLTEVLQSREHSLRFVQQESCSEIH